MRGASLGVVLLAASGLVGCNLPPPPDTATVPPNAFGQQDPTLGAIFLAQADFTSAGRTAGNPAEAAKALAALDFAAGALSTSPRWVAVSPIAKMRMLQARVAMRQAMGIDANAPSQVVVNDLLAASKAFASGDTGAIPTILPQPVFPADIAQRLNAMPYLEVANLATTLAGTEALSGAPFGGNGED